MPTINQDGNKDAGKPQLTLQQMMDAAKQSKPEQKDQGNMPGVAKPGEVKPVDSANAPDGPTPQGQANPNPQVPLNTTVTDDTGGKVTTKEIGDGLKSTVATPPPESNPAITPDGCIATDAPIGKTFVGRPQAGSKATIRPEEVSAAKEEISAPKDATHIRIQLKDNPAKVYSIEEVDNQYDAVKKYMEDHGIRSTTNDFNVQFLTADEVNE